MVLMTSHIQSENTDFAFAYRPFVGRQDRNISLVETKLADTTTPHSLRMAVIGVVYKVIIETNMV